MAIIRQAEVCDRAALESCVAGLQLYEQSIESNRAEPEAIAPRYIAELLSACAGDLGAVFVAEVRNRIVGFTAVLLKVRSDDILEAHRDHAYVTDLYVEPPHRSRGVGRQLMQAAEAHAIASGATQIRVGVLAANIGAAGLYRRLGFRDCEITLEKNVGPAQTGPDPSRGNWVPALPAQAAVGLT